MSTVNSTETPHLQLADRVATITLNKPEYANRLSPSDLDTLRRHISAINEDKRILVLRIVARGKYFCSGYDISSLADPHAHSSVYFGETMDIIEQARPVTIAAIQGGVYGGGTDLALACDFRLGTTEANMFMPATRLGLHFYSGGLQRYVTRLGLDPAKRLLLTAEKIEAAEMLRIGFLTHLVDSSKLETNLEQLTSTLLEMAPLPLIGVKKSLNLIAKGVLARDEINKEVRRSEATEDIKEGARAWKEKRKPVFWGR